MSKPLLQAENLTIEFLGVKAADGVSLTVNTDEFLAIIGTNGSGKTTFLNLCTGYVHPVAGDVYLEGHRITRLDPRAITRLGIARAFQIPQLFMDRTVLDSLMLSIAARCGIWQGLRPLARASYRSEALELLDLVGLGDMADQRAAELSEGVRKLVDILLALALKPRLLLLDEPTSSVSAEEKFGLMEKLMTVLREQQVTALFVEHDMEIVRRYADRVMVWDSGKVIAEGVPEVVLNNQQVVKNVVGMV